MNAKNEFIHVTKGYNVLCAVIDMNTGWEDEDELKPKIYLKSGYTSDEYDQFLKSIDFEYDTGFGSQNLFGTIWCDYGRWFKRGEYDGSEWWESHQYPAIPAELIK